MTPTVFFATTCKGRTQHLRQTLPQNMADNPAAYFLVLDYGSTDDLQDFLATIQDPRLIHYRFPTSAPFHMAHAKNMAHRLALLNGADIIANLDADNFAGPAFDAYLAQSPLTTYHAMGRMIPGVLPRGISGRIAVSRNAFLSVGGYDERFNTWSPDDKDFNQRLRRAGFTYQEIPRRFLNCIRHNDRLRFREYAHAKHIPYTDTTAQGPTTVNHGHFGCGILSNGTSLPPLPTRIFGIGMHKTGTTSLARALNLLGFPCEHWPTAHWARQVYEHPETLDRHYAATDLPITVMFRELDQHYPGAKFVLTVRDPNTWIESVKRHWDPTTNPFRHQWTHDPFTHKIHRIVYGQKGLDAELFLDRYRQHNYAVMSHFRTRPNDLLVMHPSDGWEPLCRFLSIAPPKQPYPHINPYN